MNVADYHKAFMSLIAAGKPGGKLALIVCGGRNYKDRARVFSVLDTLNPFLVLHGACSTGADQLADRWCKLRGVAVYRFPADWRTHGRAAGPKRNAEMARALSGVFSPWARACVWFPGGAGTQNMIKTAQAFDVAVLAGDDLEDSAADTEIARGR